MTFRERERSGEQNVELDLLAGGRPFAPRKLIREWVDTVDYRIRDREVGAQYPRRECDVARFAVEGEKLRIRGRIRSGENAARWRKGGISRKYAIA
jgi:hypothetical protein